MRQQQPYISEKEVFEALEKIQRDKVGEPARFPLPEERYARCGAAQFPLPEERYARCGAAQFPMPEERYARCAPAQRTGMTGAG